MAKIHTVEWTPAIVPHPIMRRHERELVGAGGGGCRTSSSSSTEGVAGGIVGSSADHHAAPYSLTEEFVAVYRMHPLMPDDYAFHSLATGRLLETRQLQEIAVRRHRRLPSGSTCRICFTRSAVAIPAR